MAQDASPTQPTKECRRDITAATRYLKSTSCYAVVLFCNECVHGENGVLEKQTSKPCGVCFGFSF